ARRASRPSPHRGRWRRLRWTGRCHRTSSSGICRGHKVERDSARERRSLCGLDGCSGGEPGGHALLGRLVGRRTLCWWQELLLDLLLAALEPPELLVVPEWRAAADACAVRL